MTRPEFVAALKELGWSGAYLAKRLGTTANTVSAWRTGKAPVPGYAAAYLDLALKVKRLAKEAGEIL